MNSKEYFVSQTETDRQSDTDTYKRGNGKTFSTDRQACFFHWRILRIRMAYLQGVY